jgi:protein ImuB
MYWIALSPSHEEERTAWGWKALRFTPRVAHLDEAIVLEVAASERLWGGRKRLAQKLLKTDDSLSPVTFAAGATSRVALALLRLRMAGEAIPVDLPDGLPLVALTEARPHVPMLERIGCRTWGQLRALPRPGISRRFGASLLKALDQAYGDQPESHAWLDLPEHFDLKVELPALATSTPELMWTGQRLLSFMQLWLQARNRGVLAFELEWTLDLKRLNGKRLPPTEAIEIRTAKPTQAMTHLRRLVNEHLPRHTISAPANHLRLRSIDTAPWGGIPASLLPEDNRPGDKLHEFIERVTARLGEENVKVPQPHSDHRPEHMQAWVPAKSLLVSPAPSKVFAEKVDSLYPTWLLPEPVPLEMKGPTPCWHGPLRRLTRLFRIESAWWEEQGPACRDYFIARSEEAGLVWIYRERPSNGGASRWYLQGIYA